MPHSKHSSPSDVYDQSQQSRLGIQNSVQYVVRTHRHVPDPVRKRDRLQTEKNTVRSVSREGQRLGRVVEW